MKRTYVYHILIGNNENVDVDLFMLARNAGVAIEFCQDIYRQKHYNSYKAIKVGVSDLPQDTRIMNEEETEQLIRAGAANSDKFSERF